MEIQFILDPPVFALLRVLGIGFALGLFGGMLIEEKLNRRKR